MTKIQYRLANGKNVELEVTDEQAEVIIKTKQKFENNETKHKLRKLRETSLDQIVDEYGWEQADETVDIQREVEREDEAERVRRAVACLSEKQQMLVRLRFYEDKQPSEIAEMLGVSKSAVTQQFKTIYGTLREILENF